MSSVFVSARFPQELVSEAQERAELEDRSLSSVIRLAVQRYVAEHDRESEMKCPTCWTLTAVGDGHEPEHEQAAEQRRSAV
jgi:metal-responsive CopG/Arc/MetJ family transcriptional regulator